MIGAVESDQNTHLIYIECKHPFHFCISQAVFIYYLSDDTVLSKYPNTLRKFSKLLVRDMVYWYCTTRLRPTSSETRASIKSYRINVMPNRLLARPAFSL